MQNNCNIYKSYFRRRKKLFNMKNTYFNLLCNETKLCNFIMALYSTFKK